VTLIAAGEMITRPSAVVKELVENSLDAQAGEIRVDVRERLDRFLEVADDGTGIAPDDLPLALEPHATSKLRSEDDLGRLTTLGFRGEALPSIARVGRVTVLTRTAGSDTAWRVTATGEGIDPPRPATRARGTTVRVEDLFYNAPVRKRHLKSPAYEIRLARGIIHQYALLSLPVAWRLRVGDRDLVDLPPAGGLADRLTAVFGKDVASSAIPIAYRGAGAQPVTVEGFLGAPETARPSPQHQMHFANGRAVLSARIIQALRQGYGDLIPSGRHPWAVLFVTVAPEELDVNVHPTKREVRFFNDDMVFQEILRAVRQGALAFRPTLSWPAAGSIRPHDEGVRDGGSPPTGRGFYAGAPGARELEAARALYGREAADSETPALPGALDGIAPTGSGPWQVGLRYVVSPRETGLLVVDQHAAHERILYEHVLGRWRRERLPSQKLLFPEVLEVGDEGVEAFEAVAGEIARLGFQASVFGAASLLVEAVPVLTRKPVPARLLGEILEEVVQSDAREGEAMERFAKSFACRCAVRSGEDLTREEMTRLLEELFATEVPHGDPHGRPAYVEIRVEDLDRRFQRS
jgi:DNA mismatch repair protein MutL